MPPGRLINELTVNALDFEAIKAQFERGLAECESLYSASARLCVREHASMIPGSVSDFALLMGDLHRGLVVKIYTSIARADGRWTKEEQALGTCLFRHVWRKRLSGRALREAVKHVSVEGDRLKWYSLIRPFDQIAPLRNRIGDLETIVMRLANLVAKADGSIGNRETEIIQTIQNELDQLIRPSQLDLPGHHAEAQQTGNRAVQEIRVESEQVHKAYDLQSSGPGEQPDKSSTQQLRESLDQLQQLVGLAAVKQEVQTLTNVIKLQQQRVQAGLPNTELSRHMVFRGNPGTGKTTVARIVGQIFGAMGMLAKGHLVETDRSGLVAEYAGQTAPKTNQIVDAALDGVLFIDEAYSLVDSSNEDPFGREALQSLLKRMEDDRQRLVVILAGYPEPLENLLRSNPGLSSRFNTKLTFADYGPRELGQIFDVMCQRNHYQIPSATRSKLLLGFGQLFANRDEHFGNGRLVRNVFENAIRKLANRVIGVAPLTTEMLSVLLPEDIVFPGIPNPHSPAQDWNQAKFRVGCPECQAESTVPGSYLGQRVRCNRCDHRFVAAWGDPE